MTPFRAGLFRTYTAYIKEVGLPEVVSSGEEVVEMENQLRFLPDTVRIRPGDTVLWRNSSDLIHTVTADPEQAARSESVRLPPSAELFHSGDIRPGGEFRHAFPIPGEYKYFCAPHELAGMTGMVIVEEEARSERGRPPGTERLP